jgi:hypothetical protein
MAPRQTLGREGRVQGELEAMARVGKARGSVAGKKGAKTWAVHGVGNCQVTRGPQQSVIFGCYLIVICWPPAGGPQVTGRPG